MRAALIISYVVLLSASLALVFVGFTGYVKKQLIPVSQAPARIVTIEPKNGTQLQNTQIPDKLAQKKPKRNLLVLNESNTLALRGEVSVGSMNKLSVELLAMSMKLGPKDVIYLVLDTPGGDVIAGNRFLDLAEAIPQRIDTVTLDSASMGFHISQRLGQRLILPTGTMMSHRMRIQGLSGQVAEGELETRMKEIQALALRLDEIASERMGITVARYRELIKDEYYASGQKAVDEKAADAVVYATCDNSLSGTTTTTVETMFGAQSVRVSKCPLISGPI